MLLPVVLDRGDLVAGRLEQGHLLRRIAGLSGLAGQAQVLILALKGAIDDVAVLGDVAADLLRNGEVLGEGALEDVGEALHAHGCWSLRRRRC